MFSVHHGGPGKTVTVFPLTTSLSRRIPRMHPKTVMEGILEYAARKKDHIVSLILRHALSPFPTNRNRNHARGGMAGEFHRLLDEKRERVETFQPARFAKTPTKMRKRISQARERTGWAATAMADSEATSSVSTPAISSIPR
jgi:hypothetical protein